MEQRYDFGRNWSELALRFDADHLKHAQQGVQRLVGDVNGCNFLDIGCGSGLHAAAALALGAKSVLALDYDPRCVSTTTAVLERFSPAGNWNVERADILSPDTLSRALFDVVYSWGVLHHTGDMWRAVRNAAALVAPGGRLCLALYLQTPLCGAWRAEKRIYSKQRWLRPFIKWPFVAMRLSARQLRHGDAVDFVKTYSRQRGMEFLTDADDWLGGYPYQSVSASALEREVTELGFSLQAAFNTQTGTGWLGTGCGEWRFGRTTPSTEAT